MLKKTFAVAMALSIALVAPVSLSAAEAAAPTSAPLYTLNIQAGSTKAISYRHLKGATKIDFRGTPLAPSSKGEATVKSVRGAVQVDARFENLEGANKFGAEYLTYVLWAISPEGRSANLGELIIKDGRSRLRATTQLQAFALVVTAEPYFAVTQVSNVVVLENAIRKDTKGQVEEMAVQYDLLQRGQYSLNANPADLKATKTDKKISEYVFQARNAVSIARASGAEQLAPESFKKAEALMNQAQDNMMSKKNVKMVPQIAREAVQTAEDARLIALKRADAKKVSETLSAAEAAVKAAEEQRANAQTASEKAQADAAFAQASAALAKEDADRSRSDAALSKTEAEAARLEAQEKVAAAEAEKAALREQLRAQLNSVLETKDSARGLIVNMSDVLFATGKYELKPPVREKLAKVAGIVLGHSGLKLQVEGHTDNVGSDAFNQKLSEQRAEAVRGYLVSQGIQADVIQAKGFGKSAPLASNDTADGRSQNRRVEIVVSGDQIGEPTPTVQ